jgi:hypothetical protein
LIHIDFIANKNVPAIAKENPLAQPDSRGRTASVSVVRVIGACSRSDERLI